MIKKYYKIKGKICTSMSCSNIAIECFFFFNMNQNVTGVRVHPLLLLVVLLQF